MKIDIKQISFYHPVLRELLLWIADETGLDFTITSEHRDDGGIHDTIPLRSVDLRCKQITIGWSIDDYINAHWKYDPQRPQMKCSIFHDTGQGLHLHIQVHPNTRKI